MDNRYNLYNLEASFKNYLLAGNILPVSLKNYLSDFRHFQGWLVFYIKSHFQPSVGTIHELSLQNTLIPYLTKIVIEEYKSYLVENKIPIRTINRRLSTVRKFCSFCISQGWMKENPAKKVTNVILNEVKDLSRMRDNSNNSSTPLTTRLRDSSSRLSVGTQNDVLQQFHQDLLKENLDKKTIKSYLNDVEDFLSM